MSLDDKVVLITGGTGSFGRKFTQLILERYKPARLLIYSRDELKQMEMNAEFDSACLRYFLGDVRDCDRLKQAMRGVDVVVHAAAMKHVPACEYNPVEAVRTNVLGAVNIIEAANAEGVPKVLALSTDKACGPANLYGATKLCAEKLFIHANTLSGRGGPRFSCVRYGNVLGSRGSVVPLFRAQKAAGTPITITDPRMTRFWMTLQQGVSFVMHCVGLMRGGEIFVPRIPSMRVTDVAEVIAPGMQTVTVGIRGGEKIHETLVTEDESRITTEYDDMYVIDPNGTRSGWTDRGRPAPPGFRYTSDTNERWLSPDELRELLA